jgi:poly(A) polymerase
MPPLISVIIPTLDEELALGATLDAIAGLRRPVEVLVVDGGSRDATVAVARQYGARVVESERGRGLQLTAGAGSACGEVLWFLHADARPAPGAVECIESALRRRDVVGGYFRIRFDGTTWAARFLTGLNPHLNRLGMCYGDAGLFVRRSAYEAVGGFRPWPLFEDLDLLTRLRRRGRVARVPGTVVVSSRRFEGRSFAYVFGGWAVLQGLYWLGVPPGTLARLYRPIRGRRADTTPLQSDARGRTIPSGSVRSGTDRIIGLYSTMTEREFAIQVVRRLKEAGYQALWAGGCVRDELLRLTPKDYDVATDATPDQVRGLFRRTVAVGASFGVVEVLGPRAANAPLKVQVATFRSDVSYSDGRHPDAVVFSSPQEDAQRRDFTINGMFFDPTTGELIDYVGGRRDLDDRVLRAIGDPAQRFTEDKLRILRAARMAARFGLEIEPATAAAARAMADEITRPPPEPAGISAERIADELRKLLVDPHRARGVTLMDDLGLIEPILPELAAMKGLPQGLPGSAALPPPGAPGRSGLANDLWQHVLRVLELLPPGASFPLAFAALLHDIGKPRTVGRTPDRYTFHSHEHVGRRLASEICLRLKLSNAERERVEWLVEKHQYLCDAPRMSPSKLKPVLSHPGIEELLALHRADALASGRDTDHVAYAEARLREWGEKGELDPPPLVTGDDLKALGIPPGPHYKTLLAAVREAQLDGRIHTREEALELVKQLWEEMQRHE